MGFGYNECTNISDDPSKSVHLMIRYRSQKQLTLAGFSGSSAESVGNLGCRQVANCMIQGYF